MRKSVLPILAAVGLAAVAAHATTYSPSTPRSGEEAVAGWHLLREGPMAKLAYGLPNSDQLALMLTCEPGERSAVVYGDVQPRSAGLILASHGPQPIDPLSNGEAFETRLPLNDSALSGLASGGRMTVQTEAGDRQLTATRAERRLVQGFLSYCASGHA
ncbi:hypothetical protein [Brevundimonas guildfordensis]|jgi:hypothetical protein|uniref:Uncharacterized protein n=1 Tax=Brevundimonas guildfordensis TaxID=2762241 RepID=A0ABR8R2B4_9CAUL|nr:hypothetical protein [Brevundimonas guildfordensis]MBD7941920.1 hypothetical protein [Brevundimonas guildfordensis]